MILDGHGGRVGGMSMLGQVAYCRHAGGAIHAGSCVRCQGNVGLV